MTDLSLSVLVSRDALALDPLQINDQVDYKVAGPEFLGGQQAWDKQKVTSIFVDGEVTVHRRRQNVQEPVGVEVFGDSVSDVQHNLADLIAAFSQSRFTITVSLESAVSVYQCEAADYKITSTAPRYAAKQLHVLFQVERHPVLISGSI